MPHSKITNPKVPFLYTIPGGLVDIGQRIVVHAEPAHHCQRFSINLIKNSNQMSIFHLDFRFDQGSTVRNTSFPTGYWGPEERSGNPLVRGRRFKLEIKVHQDRFEVLVDGHHHCDYVHRVPHTEADTLEMEGDVHVHDVSFKQREHRRFSLIPGSNE